MRILLVEDDQALQSLLRQGLEREGHAVICASDGEEALETAGIVAFDVIVLDVMIPKMDGIAVSHRLRRDRNRTPILMLTARDKSAEIIRGLDSGADDYLTKPFSFDILLARLRAVSRRGPVPQPARLKVADLELDTGTHDVWRGGIRAVLTPREYSLLELLMRREGTVVSREHILDSVWGFGSDVEPNTLEAFVHLLRNKIEPLGSKKLLRTIRGIGYCIQEATE